MAAGSVDDIFVEIEVRLDRLEVGLRNAEQVIDSSTRRMNRLTQRVGEGFGGISSNVQKAIIGLGAMHISLRTLESLSNVADAGFRLWTADLEDSRVAAEGFLQAIEKIPEIGTAFKAGRGIGEFLLGFGEFFERDFGPVFADIDRFIANLDKGSTRFAESERRIRNATQVGGVIAPQGKAAERELQILDAINKEERIRLKFVFEREDLERKIGELNKLAGRASRSGEISPLTKVLGGQINEFEQIILDLIDAREREALKKRRRIQDPTETSLTALGAATFGVGRALDRPFLPDEPTKQGQDKQISKVDRTNRKLDRLIDAVQEIGFQ